MKKTRSEDIRFVHAVFCEDLRQEIGGTVSAIGLFTRALRLPSDFPLTLPKLSALIWVSFPLGEQMPDLRVQLEPPGKEPIPLEIPPPSKDVYDSKTPGALRQQGLAACSFVNLQIGEPGRLRLRVHAWDEDWLPASLYIGKAEVNR